MDFLEFRCIRAYLLIMLCKPVFTWFLLGLGLLLEQLSRPTVYLLYYASLLLYYGQINQSTINQSISQSVNQSINDVANDDDDDDDDDDEYDDDLRFTAFVTVYRLLLQGDSAEMNITFLAN